MTAWGAGARRTSVAVVALGFARKAAGFGLLVGRLGAVRLAGEEVGEIAAAMAEAEEFRY